MYFLVQDFFSPQAGENYRQNICKVLCFIIPLKN